MTQFCKRLALDLTNTLARNTKLATNLFKRSGVPIFQSKTKLNYFALTIGKAIKHLIELLMKH